LIGRTDNAAEGELGAKLAVDDPRDTA